MRITKFVTGLAFAGAVAAVEPAVATSYDDAATAAVQWLSSNQNLDGSWCAQEQVKALCTAEVVHALQALGDRSTAYFAGLTWIENHAAPNMDYRARRFRALTSYGATTSADLSFLISSQRLGVAENKGWGLSSFYDGDPLDTALVLRSAASLPGIDTAGAVGFLKNTQLTGSDRGWRVSHDQGASDDIVTAEVVRSLLGLLPEDPALGSPINDALSTIASRVTTSSPSLVKAHVALALLLNDPNSSAGLGLLALLLQAQGIDGSWSQDPYLTALVSSSLAIFVGEGIADAETVYIPDPYLRAAINSALRRNSGDRITRGDIARLISLEAVGVGISSLRGLEYASNLQYLDLRYNQINTLQYLIGLPGASSALLEGNPLSETEDADQDGMSDAAELRAGTLPLVPDSDGDGLLDGADPYPNSPTKFPVARDDSAKTHEDRSVVIPVLANDSDPDGDPLVVDTITSGPTHGSALINPDQTITYTPAAKYFGPDSFSYAVNDGRGGRAVATVNVTVIEVNEAVLNVILNYLLDD